MTQLDSSDDILDAFSLVVSELGDGKMKKRYIDIIHLYDKMKDAKQVLSIGVYGCPKMGKSTLLNSLLGDVVLPTSPIPSTRLVIDVHRCKRSDYEINCYESRETCTEGRLAANDWRRGSRTQNHFKTAGEVHQFLNKYASHGKDAIKETPFAEIEVRGPFGNADSLLRPNIVLRDTPGAEAVAEDALDKDLQADSEAAHQAIAQTDIHLFCVSCETMGSKNDVDFYDRYFRERACIHVLTMRDTVDASDDELKNEFIKRFSLIPNEEEIKDIVLTGKKEGDTQLLSEGAKKLIDALYARLSPPFLCEKIKSIACSLLDVYDRDPEWYVVRDVSRIYFERLRKIITK